MFDHLAVINTIDSRCFAFQNLLLLLESPVELFSAILQAFSSVYF